MFSVARALPGNADAAPDSPRVDWTTSAASAPRRAGRAKTQLSVVTRRDQHKLPRAVDHPGPEAGRRPRACGHACKASVTSSCIRGAHRRSRGAAAQALLEEALRLAQVALLAARRASADGCRRPGSQSACPTKRPAASGHLVPGTGLGRRGARPPRPPGARRTRGPSAELVGPAGGTWGRRGGRPWPAHRSDAPGRPGASADGPSGRRMRPIPPGRGAGTRMGLPSPLMARRAGPDARRARRPRRPRHPQSRRPAEHGVLVAWTRGHTHGARLRAGRGQRLSQDGRSRPCSRPTCAARHGAAHRRPRQARRPGPDRRDGCTSTPTHDALLRRAGASRPSATSAATRCGAARAASPSARPRAGARSCITAGAVHRRRPPSSSERSSCARGDGLDLLPILFNEQVDSSRCSSTSARPLPATVELAREHGIKVWGRCRAPSRWRRRLAGGLDGVIFLDRLLPEGMGGRRCCRAASKPGVDALAPSHAARAAADTRPPCAKQQVRRGPRAAAASTR
jgi:hypothetical protein